MTIGTRLFTWRNGEQVGTDEYGNRYFKEKNLSMKETRRWVLFDGEPEASKVPADWHRWLHKVTDELPSPNRVKMAWEKPHQPNMTGGSHAYRPQGHQLAGGVRARATGDYEAWRPE